MKDVIKTFEDLPFIVKILLCIPAVDIVWTIYRVIRSLDAKNTVAIVASIVLIVVGIPFMWLVDLICVLVNKKIWWIC